VQGKAKGQQLDHSIVKKLDGSHHYPTSQIAAAQTLAIAPFQFMATYHTTCMHTTCPANMRHQHLEVS
jgi:hypothetical protein